MNKPFFATMLIILSILTTSVLYAEGRMNYGTSYVRKDINLSIHQEGDIIIIDDEFAPSGQSKTRHGVYVRIKKLYPGQLQDMEKNGFDYVLYSKREMTPLKYVIMFMVASITVLLLVLLYISRKKYRTATSH